GSVWRLALVRHAGRYAHAGRAARSGLQVGFDQRHQMIEALLKGVTVAVRAAADPERALASFLVANRYHPKSHVNHVEHESQSNAHQHHTGPDSPLSGLVRNLQTRVVAHLQIDRLELIG